MPDHLSAALMVDATLYTLVLFSVITWVIVFFKIWQFSKNSYDNRRFNQVFWDASSLAEAQSLPAAIVRGPEARIAGCGFAWLADNHQDGKARLRFQGSPEELLEQALRLQTQRELRSMDSGLTFLASIASTAPFVGLFGTVVGIMHALQDISKQGSASLDVVAGPIGDALIATAIGIAVAVPAVLAYNFFVRKAKNQRQELENFADGFLHIAFNANQQ